MALKLKEGHRGGSRIALNYNMSPLHVSGIRTSTLESIRKEIQDSLNTQFANIIASVEIMCLVASRGGDGMHNIDGNVSEHPTCRLLEAMWDI